MTKVPSLIERVGSGDGSDRRLDAEIACEFVFHELRPARADDHLEHQRGCPPSAGDIWTPTGFLMADSYTTSLDAVTSLIERVLPDSEWSVWKSSMRVATASVGAGPESVAATPARALLSALLRAVSERNVHDR